jgi:hypothetical protein
MSRILSVALALCFVLLAVNPACAASAPLSASIAAKRSPSDIDGVDFIVTYDAGRPARDYSAESRSSLAPGDPYAVQREADQGLVHLMNQNGRRVKRYTIARAKIRSVVRVKYDMTELDRADLVFTDGKLIVVHTTESNGGIFTSSDVYELRLRDGQVADTTPIARNPSLMKMVEIGVAEYRLHSR